MKTISQTLKLIGLLLSLLLFCSKSISAEEPKNKPNTNTKSKKQSESPSEKLSKTVKTIDTSYLPKDQLVWLDQQQLQPGLYSPSRESTIKGTVIIIQTPGKLRLDPSMATLLYHYLPDRNWHTLLVTLPEPPINIAIDLRHKPVTETAKQQAINLQQHQQILQQAVKYARKRDSKPVVVIAQKQSAMHLLMAMQQLKWLALDPEQGSLQGVILLDAHNSLIEYKDFDITPFIQKLRVPTLDVISQKNTRSMTHAKKRLAASRKADNQFSQMKLLVNSSHYHSANNLPTSWISAWLNRL